MAVKSLGKAVKATAEKVKGKLAPTAVAMGLMAPSEESEAAYIPLKAFAEGSEAAQALFKKAQKRIDEGADTRPNGELYQEMGVYKSEDGDYKVDVAELRARNQQQMSAIGTFAEDLDFYLKSGVARSKKFEFPITRYLTEDSPIFEYFPDLKDAKVTVAPRSTDSDNAYSSLGFYRRRDVDGKPKIVVTIPKQLNLDPEGGLDRRQGDGSWLPEDKLYWDEVFGAFATLIHEFQHHIQTVKKSANTGYNRRSVDRADLQGLRQEYDYAVERLSKLEKGDPGYETHRRMAQNMEDMAYDTYGPEMKEEFRKASPEKRTEMTLQVLNDFKTGLLSKDSILPHGIYIRELGEAEARSSGLKALIPEGSERKAIGVFYPKNYTNPLGYVSRPSDIDVNDRLTNEMVLTRVTPAPESPVRHGQLKPVSEFDFEDYPEPKVVQDYINKGSDGKGAAAVVGTGVAAGLASPPSEAFVSEIGEKTGLFEDATPTPSLFDVEGVVDNLGISNTFLLDLLVPRTKPYDLISNTPVVGEAMMATDAIDSSFGDYLRGEGTEAGQRIRKNADEDDLVTDMRQGGGLETQAGKEMEDKNPNKPIPEKADINKDGEIQGWEKARHEAIMKTEKKKTAMYEGGMMADPFAPLQVVIGIDEESGNEVPAGSKAVEVRDDIPAMLSEGEYVVPADVVRYHGLKTFEEMRSEAKCALGLMAQHDRISMVDDETKEPIEYDIEEKDAPEVEEAEVKVIEAAEGTDVQASPVASTFYQLRYITDPVTGETRMTYVDPTTGLEVTPETFDVSKADRYSIENILGRETSTEEVEEEDEAEDEPKEAESTLGTQEVFPLKSDEQGDGPSGQRMTRDLGNNYGYTMEGLGQKVGFYAGPFGAAMKFADNVNNAGAISAARKDLGLEPLGFLEELGAGFTGEYNDGYVGIQNFDGDEYHISLSGDEKEIDGKTVPTTTPRDMQVITGDRLVDAGKVDAGTGGMGPSYSGPRAGDSQDEPDSEPSTPSSSGVGLGGFGDSYDPNYGEESFGYDPVGDSISDFDYSVSENDFAEMAEKEVRDEDREETFSMFNKGGTVSRKNKPRVAMMKY